MDIHGGYTHHTHTYISLYVSMPGPANSLSIYIFCISTPCMNVSHCHMSISSPWPWVYTIISWNEKANLIRFTRLSCRCSLHQPHKFGFMSFGQIPAWEYATLCKVMPFAHCLSTNSSKNCPETNQIQRGNSIHHMWRAEIRTYFEELLT